MQKRCACFLCSFIILLLVSCDLLGGSLKGYIEEYTQNAAIALHSYEVPYPRTADDTVCMSTEGSILLYLRNPQGYDVYFDYAFNNEAVQDYYDTVFKANGDTIQYTSIDTDHTSYKMTFPVEFRESLDECCLMSSDGPVKDISGTLTVYETETQRPFPETYDITLRIDTKPQQVGYALLQLDDAYDQPGAKYVLCFMLEPSLLNNDFKTLQINSDTWDVSFNDSVPVLTARSGNAGTMLVNPSPDNPLVLYPTEEGGDTFEALEGYDVFYYYSTNTISEDETSFIITITDYAGLTSSATVSNRMEHLTPVSFSVTPADEQNLIAGINGSYSMTISHNGKTVEGNNVETGSYKIQIVCDVTCNGETKQYAGDAPFTLDLPIDSDYTLSAKATCVNYLSSEAGETESFNVIHNPQFFISADGDADGLGTTFAPFSSFQKCKVAINEYVLDYGEPADGFVIGIMSDFCIDNENEFNSRYLFDSSNFDITKLTIRGTDKAGSTELHTIEMGINNKGCISWAGGTITLQDLAFSKCHFSMSPSDAPVYGACASLYDTEDAPLSATIKNCTFTDNSLSSSASDDVNLSFGAGLAVLTQDTRSNITIDGCTFDSNTCEKYACGAGIAILKTLWDNPECGTVTIKGKTTICNNSSNEFCAGLYTDGNLILDTVAINGNTVSNETDVGAGLHLGPHAEVTIKGATNITENTVGPIYSRNVFLPLDTADNQKTLKIEGNLAGSEIGISTESPWAIGRPPVVFATYSTKPNNIFFQDDGLSTKNIRYTASGAQIGMNSWNSVFNNWDGIPDNIVTSMEINRENITLQYYYFPISVTTTEGTAIPFEITSITVTAFKSTLEQSTDTWFLSDNILYISTTLPEQLTIAPQASLGDALSADIIFTVGQASYSCSFFIDVL